MAGDGANATDLDFAPENALSDIMLLLGLFTSSAPFPLMSWKTAAVSVPFFGSGYQSPFPEGLGASKPMPAVAPARTQAAN